MTLKEHIDDIRKGLETGQYDGNEAAVSQGIVLRLLNALAWPIFNTQIVYPQYPVGGGKVDFALCHPSSKSPIFIEVKQVGNINIEGSEGQLFVYVLDYNEVIPIAVLTDGQKWRFFHPMGAKRCQEQKVRELDLLDLIKDKSEKIADCLNRYLNYESIRTGEAVEAIKEDYEQIVQQKQVATRLPEARSKLMEHVPPRFLTIPSELYGEDNKVFVEATWKVACIRWWVDERERPVPWEIVEEMISSTQFSLESILGCDVYERCVKYLMQTTRSAKKFRKWVKRYRSIRNMSKWIGWYMGILPVRVKKMIVEVRVEHNSTSREGNKDA